MWEIIKDKIKIARFENAKPLVEITPKLDGKLAFLMVQNKGQSEASFSILVTKWLGTNQLLLPYYGRWKGTDNNIFPIPSEAPGFLEIANAEGIYEDNQQKRVNLAILENNKTEKVNMPLDGEVKFCIKVFSQPQLKAGGEYVFLMSIGEGGHWNKFEEVNEND